MREAGPNVARWAWGSSQLLGLSLVPGRYFVLTRDLLVFPRGHFLTCGMLGLCGMVVHPRLRERGAYMGGLLVLPEYMDPVSSEYFPLAPDRRVYLRSVRARDRVLHLLGAGGHRYLSVRGRLNQAVKRGDILPLAKNEGGR